MSPSVSIVSLAEVPSSDRQILSASTDFPIGEIGANITLNASLCILCSGTLDSCVSDFRRVYLHFMHGPHLSMGSLAPETDESRLTESALSSLTGWKGEGEGGLSRVDSRIAWGSPAKSTMRRAGILLLLCMLQAQ